MLSLHVETVVIMGTQAECKVELTFPNKNKTMPPPIKERLVTFVPILCLCSAVFSNWYRYLQLQWLLSKFLLAIFQTDQQHKLETFFGGKKEGSGEKGRKWVVVIRFGTH